MRGCTGLKYLPTEVQGMILEQLITDIDIDHPRDVERWTNRSPPLLPDIMEPQSFDNDPIPCTGQRFNSKVLVTIRARLQNKFSIRGEEITVEISRRWIELLQSGIFHDVDLVFFGRNMDVEIIEMRTRYIPSIVTLRNMAEGPDHRTEAAVRALLAQTGKVRVHDLKLKYLHLSPRDVAGNLPRLHRVEIFQGGVQYPWHQEGMDVPSNIDGEPNVSSLRVITEKEAQLILTAGVLPHDTMDILGMRDWFLELAMIWNPQAPVVMSTGDIQRSIRTSGWMGQTRLDVRFDCVAEGSEDWLNSRRACVELRLNLARRDELEVETIHISESTSTDSDLWNSLLHFDL